MPSSRIHFFAAGDQIRRLHELVNEALFERLVRPELLALHDQPERTLQTDQAWKPLRASGAWHQTEPRLRQANLRVPLIDEKPPMAGEGNLIAAAEGHPIERRNDRLAAGLHASKLIEHRSAALQEVGRVDRPRPERFDLLKVSASNEHALLAGR